MIGDKIKKIRKSKGWKQEDLAKFSGYSRSSIINWETGKRAPRADDIERLASVLGVSSIDLIVDTTDKPGEYTTTGAWTLPFPREENAQEDRHNEKPSSDFAYWGGVIDEANKVLERGNVREISTVETLLKLAYDIISSGWQHIKQGMSSPDVAQHMIGIMAVSGGENNKNGVIMEAKPA